MNRAALAEEETRLVAKGPARSSPISRAALRRVSFGRQLLGPRRLWPRTSHRPQTACGRCSPWEPTALRCPGDHYNRPPSAIVFDRDGKPIENPVPPRILVWNFLRESRFRRGKRGKIIGTDIRRLLCRCTGSCTIPRRTLVSAMQPARTARTSWVHRRRHPGARYGLSSRLPQQVSYRVCYQTSSRSRRQRRGECFSTHPDHPI